MDLLSQRYANPYVILDDFIRLGQLHDFSNEVMKTIADEKIQKVRWEYYLHKVFDMTFDEYVEACESQQSEQPEMTNQQKKEIINNSSNILDEFNL